MELIPLLAGVLDREAELTRRALERVPEGKNAWKPHEKSMPLGQLAHMLALMPSWIAMMVERDELDIKPKEGGQAPREIASTKELVASHDKSVEQGRKALVGSTAEALATEWKLLDGGKVVQRKARYEFVLESFLHLAHHRGQLTVYLRLLGEQVPAIYGPSADDHRF